MASQKLAMANFQTNQPCVVSRSFTRSSRRHLDDECARDSGPADAQALDETVGWPGTYKSWPWPTSANSTADRAVRLRASRHRCRRACVCVPNLLNSVHQLGVERQPWDVCANDGHGIRKLAMANFKVHSAVRPTSDAASWSAAGSIAPMS
jgi:hypothetical protein